MADGHPRDVFGRVLPHASWPADRHAPGDLEFLRRFCNSINRENGAERFDSPAALDAWCVSEGADVVEATRDELAHVIAVREALHELLVANSSGDLDAAAHDVWPALATLLADARLGVVADASGVRVAAVGTRLPALLGRLALAVAAAVHDGTWPRLKACHHCHWVVYDPSKNRSSRWCSMSACGGRHNAREYRRRQRASG